MKKKVIFGTALFIIVGLFMFTFANPNDKVSDEKTSKQTVKEVEETPKEEQKSVEPKKEETPTSSSTTRRTVRRTITTTQAPVAIQTPVTEAVNNNNDEAAKKAEEEKAKQEAEEKAKQEAEDLAKYKEAAKEELKNYNKDVDYSDKNKDAVADIKTDGYDAIDDAKTKDEVDKALQDAKDLIDALDTIAPVITVAEDEELYQKSGKADLNDYTVTDNVSAKDKIDVTISVTKDGKKVNEVNYNNVGTYAIAYTATDEAGNVATAVRNIKVKEVKAIELVLMAGDEDVTNVTDTYIAGDKAKDIDVYVKYNNGNVEKLNAQVCRGFFPFITCSKGYYVDGTINTAKAFFGTKKLTYTYAGVKAVTYSYKVIPQAVVSLEVVSNKDTYIQGQAFDIVVNATWNNGKVEKAVAYTTKANTKTVGENQTAVIEYKGAKTTYAYNVIARKVVSLEVVSNKTTYIQGQAFDIVVNATWNDGKVEKAVAYNTNANTNVIGYGQKATIEYKGAKATYTYNVIAKKITSITVALNKDTYVAGQDFDIKKVVAIWNDGSATEITDYIIIGNTNNVGNGQKGYVSYNNKLGEFKYNVIARKVDSLVVSGNKATYIQGQAFGITVKAIWNDGAVEENVAYTTTANTNTVKNNQIAIITYKNASTSFKYNVIARKVDSLVVSGNKATYIQGQAFGITVKAIWNDGAVEENVAYTTTANTKTVKNNQTAIITYKNASTSFKYNVIARKVESLTVNSTNNTYYQNDAFTITVDATWNDGTVENNVAYTTTANTKTVGQNQTAIIEYKGAKATYTYNVISKYTLRVVSTDTEYIKGEPIDNITVYANGKPVTGYTISGDTSKVGYGQTATISYKGATVTYTYNVKYELHLVRHGYMYYLEFKDNVNVKSIEYYDDKGKKSTIYLANNYHYTNKVDNKYYLDNSEYKELHLMNGSEPKQKLVITVSDGSQYTYTKVIATNK